MNSPADREAIARIIEAAMGAVTGAALDMTMTHVRMGVIADEARDKAVAAILALTAPNPTEGWKLVPETPTKPMLDALGLGVHPGKTAYAAMLKSAPDPQDRTA